MAQNILQRRSTIQGKTPTTSSLQVGEIALNTYDGKAYIHKSGSTQSIESIVITNSTTTGSITLTERVLEPKELNVNQQVCKKDFRGDWMAEDMGISAFDNLSKTFADFILTRYAAGVAAENEISFWRGATGTTGQYDGICTLIALDAALPSAFVTVTVNSDL